MNSMNTTWTAGKPSASVKQGGGGPKPESLRRQWDFHPGAQRRPELGTSFRGAGVEKRPRDAPAWVPGSRTSGPSRPPRAPADRAHLPSGRDSPMRREGGERGGGLCLAGVTCCSLRGCPRNPRASLRGLQERPAPRPDPRRGLACSGDGGSRGQDTPSPLTVWGQGSGDTGWTRKGASSRGEGELR